jgi:uncharacterized protein YceH (UPF0502 family)
VQFALQQLIEREPPMVAALPRQPGQKEGRYAHLLSGEPDIPVPSRATTAAVSSPGLETRVMELEVQMKDLRSRLQAIEDGMTSKEEDFA